MMPTQILPAQDHAGKRMPMCQYPQTMHDFQPLATATQTVDGVTVSKTLVACTRCGAALMEEPEPDFDNGRGPAQVNQAAPDGSILRTWADARAPEGGS